MLIHLSIKAQHYFGGKAILLIQNYFPLLILTINGLPHRRAKG